MNSVLIDTCVWSLALRRRSGDLSTQDRRLVREWATLVKNATAVLIGPIRQEVLSGIRHEPDFVALQQRLSAFGQVEIVPEDYDRAAFFFNTCRAQGIAGTPIDLLICAVAERAGIAIFTADSDFASYATVLPITLHAVPKRTAR